MRMLSSFLLLASAPLALLAAADQPPTVRTVDLPSLVGSARNPVQISGAVEPAAKPGTSVHSDTIEWRGEEGKEMARVAALMPIDIQSNGNDLRTVLRAICDRANMRFIIVGDDPVMDAPVTLQGVHRPWEFLQTLASIYNLEIVFKHGLWQIYVSNSGELVARTYLLRHNTLERFAAAGAGSASNSNGSSGTRGSSAGESTSSTSQGSVGASGASGAANPDRTGQSVFSVDSNALVSAVQKFLGLQTNGHANFASADGGLGMAGPRRSSSAKGLADSAPVPGSSGPGGSGAGIVQFTEENNTLFVVATRSQHELLAAWIAQMDQPQKQILVESKFLLTSVNPSSHRGLQNPLFSDSGVSVGLSGLKNQSVDPSDVSTWKIPQAILTASDLNARLSLMNSESNTSMVQYPTQVTLSGREVTLRSVKQIPIVSTSMRDTSGSATNTSAQIQFIDVGTVVAILPKVLNEKNVLLNISIQVSSISSTVTIDGNPYPVVTSQTYQNQVIVESGFSLALGGLEQTLSTENAKKLPFFGDIPFFGFLAKDVTKDATHSVLTMIVTPVIMADYNGGNTTGTAQFTLPARGTIDRSVFQGRTDSTIEDVQVSLRGFSREVDELDQVLREGRGDRRMYTRAQLLENELDLMGVTLKRELAAGRRAPTVEADVQSYRNRVRRILKDMPRTQPLS